jgi:small subunit ribosomal protein S1
MSDQTDDTRENDEGKSFSELIDAYNEGMGEDLQVGDQVEGEIIAIGTDTVFVNTGSKIDGAVDREELLDENGELPCDVGDRLTLYVVSINENEMRLSRAISGIGGLRMLQDAHERKIPVEGKVKGQVKGGFHVEVLQRRAFCPISQIDTRYVETPEDYVGQTLSFLVVRLEEKGRNIVLSRRELLEKEQAAAREEFLKTVSVGDTTEGRVTRLMPYGAFVELFPGLEGMVHVSELSWSRVENPADVVSPDDRVTVKILDISEGQKPGEIKLSLSMKATTGDPWETVTDRFSEGEKVRGKVTRCVDFGAFVEIAPGIEGLVHISEMSYKKRVHKPEEVVSEGETVDLTIKEIDPERKRIGLSIRDAEGDPWGDVTGKYEVGQTVQGTVEKKEKFGIFVTLEPGITGLLPKSKIRKSQNAGEIEKLGVDDPITVLVEEIHPKDRKITLGPTDAKEEGDWRDYAPKGKDAGGLGALGEKLKQALREKE